jgi:7,8-dihydropterin-6-yl-methyl-4-(beta-D-ribofuranosyl)aminobenzene 5'-phosphate synthase
MPVYKVAAVLVLLAFMFPAVGDDDQTHQVQDLKITILSTMMTQVGIGEWGFSALVEVDGHRILFDTGLRPDTVLKNARSMKVDLNNIEEIVLSHNHGDHTGGLVNLRQQLAAENDQAVSTVHVAPAIFWERPGSSPEWSMAPRKEAYEAAGGHFVVHEKAVEIYPGVWLTGPVPRRHPEKNYGYWVDDKHRVGQVRSPDGLVEDNIPESMSLVINTEKGLVVISGCGHAGLINTLEYAMEITGTKSIHAAIGGFHLLQASDADLDWTANKLVDLELEHLVGAHCTGLEPVYRLRTLVNLDRSTAVVGATGASFTLADGIEPMSLTR